MVASDWLLLVDVVVSGTDVTTVVDNSTDVDVALALASAVVEFDADVGGADLTSWQRAEMHTPALSHDKFG
jgi:hypothetical protein